MLRSSFLAVALLLSVANSTPGPTMLTKAPSKMTDMPSKMTDMPSKMTDMPTMAPSDTPTKMTSAPTMAPSKMTNEPTTSSPTKGTDMPTMAPSDAPTKMTSAPTMSPSSETGIPTAAPSDAPTKGTDMPSMAPTKETGIPTTSSPTIDTGMPTMSPSIECVVTDEPLINSNTDGTNYAIGWFGADGDAFLFDREDTDGYILWPYRIGVCTALTPTNSAFGKFTCEEGGIRLQRYSAANCEGDPLTDVVYPDAVLQSPEIAAVYPTKCDGNNDGNYASFEFSAGADGCTLDTPAYGVLGVCGVSKMYPTFYADALAKMYCDKDGAALEFFEVGANKCDADGEICQRMLIDDSCGELFSTTDGTTVYGRIVDCESAEKDTSREEIDQSSSPDQNSTSSEDDNDTTDDTGSTASVSLFFLSLWSVIIVALV